MNGEHLPAESEKSMSWLSSDELRECEPAAAAGRRGNSGAASCPDDDDVVETTFLSPAENADES